MRQRLLIWLGLVVLALSTNASAQKQVPYWASISAGKARMRTGPGQQFPANWVYQRSGLPIKVVKIYPNWRKIEDPEGVQGWMLASLISDVRTALIKGSKGTILPLRENPDASAQILWRAEAGVIGRLLECKSGWCRIDIRGRMGYIEAEHLYGV